MTLCTHRNIINIENIFAVYPFLYDALAEECEEGLAKINGIYVYLMIISTEAKTSESIFSPIGVH